MKEVWLSILEFLGLAWWVEIVTEAPSCIYYFGPFVSVEEAKAAQAGYIEDLEREGAKGIKVAIKRCKPKKLTVFDEEAEEKQARRGGISPILTGQLQ
ncbi:MAG: DUF1816 domain-containing protein [Cyanobacteria bacterium CRU_2_1]|nr:DUF1816 domain-containing protein [Cyanobacteria bacterium RU_5_0]NJR62991.1 DUF1816 domain-containing protein [Cyanobacteria bacterium CRU_2_1]